MNLHAQARIVMRAGSNDDTIPHLLQEPSIMKLGKLFGAVVLLAAAVLPLPAGAALYLFNLSPAQVVPASTSGSLGLAQVSVYDGAITVAGTIFNTYTNGIEYIELRHAPAGSNGPVVFNVYGNLTDMDFVRLSGFHTIPNSFAFLSDFKSIPLPLSWAIMAKPYDYYLEIRSEQFPNGELRGQLAPAPIPEPSTMGLFGAGLALMGLAVRRRTTKR